MTPDDLKRIIRETFVADVEHHAEIGSTNDRALEFAKASDSPLPYLVTADAQTSGRGRGKNQWWSADGALMFSLALRPDPERLPRERWPQFSLTTGLAISEAISTTLPVSDVRIKWPNDVFVNGRKVCGVLIEIPPERNDTLVIGIGINVNNSFERAPEELRRTATSISDLAGYEHERVDVLLRVLKQLEVELERLSVGDASLSERWQSLCFLRDKHVRLLAGETLHEGPCLGMNADGALVLRTGEGPTPFFGGTIQSFSSFDAER